MKTINSFLMAGMLLIAGSNVMALTNDQSDVLKGMAIGIAARAASKAVQDGGDLDRPAAFGTALALSLVTTSVVNPNNWGLSFVTTAFTYIATLVVSPVRSNEQIKAERNAAEKARLEFLHREGTKSSGYRVVERVY